MPPALTHHITHSLYFMYTIQPVRQRVSTFLPPFIKPRKVKRAINDENVRLFVCLSPVSMLSLTCIRQRAPLLILLGRGLIVFDPSGGYISEIATIIRQYSISLTHTH